MRRYRLLMTACVFLIAIGLQNVLAANSEGQGIAEKAMPKIVLPGRLAKCIAITDCEYISGMTCKITYNGTEPLPSEIYFFEYDEMGISLVKRTRLIYPNLKAGETGYATFRLKFPRPAKLILDGIWDGPWKSPY